MTSQKQRELTAMFSRVARGYDRINRVLSMGLDVQWRRIAVRACRLQPGAAVLDVATGTGDFILELARQGAGVVIGVDPCVPMLVEGRPKLKDPAAGDADIYLVEGAAEALPAPSGRFDAVTIGFGLRNVCSLEETFSEMLRVLRPGGRVVALEISRPKSIIMRFLFSIYFYYLGPLLARWMGGDEEAYHYLPRSTRNFVSREVVCRTMETSGLCNVRATDLTFGVVCLYTADRAA